MKFYLPWYGTETYLECGNGANLDIKIDKTMERRVYNYD